MATLREVKDRIASVRSTLKITSAMKLVASSKLRKAQKAVEAMRPYEAALSSALSAAIQRGASAGMQAGGTSTDVEVREEASTLVVAIAGNSSLCGGFNANAIKKTLEVVRSCGRGVSVLSIGRKMAEAMKKAGYECPADYSAIVGHTSYEAVRALANSIVERYEAGEFSRVVLVYNHFVSSARQDVVSEQYLPLTLPGSGTSEDYTKPGYGSFEDYIIEPDATEVVETLRPQVLSLKLYAAVLDSVASEQAARTVAMQTATDNAEDLLAELTLEYNKGRQQKITAELLDILGGSAQ